MRQGYVPVLTIAAVIVGLLGAGSETRAEDFLPEDLEARCSDLQRADFSGLADAPTEITETEVVANEQGLPAFCRAEGYVAPNTALELRLPLKGWNGKFFYAGCTGSCGMASRSSWVRECDYPLSKGYACIVSDMGHRSGPSNGLWAYRNLEAKVDFGYRATHRTAVSGKALTEHFYGKGPERSYFMGCSTGGRQGLVSAQRFPHDFDGIIAGASVVIEAGTAMSFIWNLQQLATADGKPLFTEDELRMVHEAALDASDEDDGLADGIITDPRRSDFDPATLLCAGDDDDDCLTRAQVAAVVNVYGGPVDSSGRKTYPGGGALPGSERGWSIYLPGADGRAPSEQSGVDTTRFMLSDWGPGWGFRDFDFDEDPKRMGEAEVLYSASHPDLRDFKAAGGKLLMYHGWADPIVAPMDSVDYYEMVERVMGGAEQTRDFARLFMVPGMKHCFGGDGAYAIDYITAMENWVEKGEAPDRLKGAHLKGNHDGPSMIRTFPREADEVVFERPVFPYPRQPRYNGEGDPAAATSFEAVIPDSQ